MSQHGSFDNSEQLACASQGEIAEAAVLIQHLPPTMSFREKVQAAKSEEDLIWLCGNYRNNSNGPWLGKAALPFLCSIYPHDDLLPMVELFIEKGAKVNGVNPMQETALHVICENYRYNNLYAILDLLIQNGANANAENKSKNTPLHLLCGNYRHNNLCAIVDLLIQNGANVNTVNDYKNTPLHLLCGHYRHKNLIDIVALFISRGADPYAKNSDGVTPIENFLLPYAKDNLMEILELMIGNVPSNGRSALHWLCGTQTYKKKNVVNLVRSLIEKEGADVNAADSNGRTPFMELCRNYRKDDLMELVQMFIDIGADPNTRDSNGRTPLLELGRNEHYLTPTYLETTDYYLVEEAVQLLVEEGADLNAADLKGNTLLLELCADRYKDDMKGLFHLIIDMGADVNAKNSDGRTPLIELCSDTVENDDMVEEIIQLLIKNDANVNAVDSNGRTPFLELLSNCQEDEVKMLFQQFIDFGADVNAKDSEGRTPLLELSSNPHFSDLVEEMVQLIIEKGADVMSTPLLELCRAASQYCCNPAMIDLIQFLLDNGKSEDDALNSRVRRVIEKYTEGAIKSWKDSNPGDSQSEEAFSFYFDYVPLSLRNEFFELYRIEKGFIYQTKTN